MSAASSVAHGDAVGPEDSASGTAGASHKTQSNDGSLQGGNGDETSG